jgi:hypothetical protein
MVLASTHKMDKGEGVPSDFCEVDDRRTFFVSSAPCDVEMSLGMVKSFPDRHSFGPVEVSVLDRAFGVNLSKFVLGRRTDEVESDFVGVAIALCSCWEVFEIN